MGRKHTPRKLSDLSLRERYFPLRGEPIPPVQVHGQAKTRRSERRRANQTLRRELKGGQTDDL